MALAVGTCPKPEFLKILIERCAEEPDFFVRDTLTWAIIQFDPKITIPLLIEEVSNGASQARSQALHTLSKIHDTSGWRAISDDVLSDSNDDVARSAWRAAVILAPKEDREHVAQVLVDQLGRGNHDLQLSLSRAIIALGDDATEALEKRMKQGNKKARTHALATEQMRCNPEKGFEMALSEAKKKIILTERKIY